MLNAVRVATRRQCEKHARPKEEAVRLWPWYLTHVQNEAALVIEALKVVVPGIRLETRPDPHAAGSQDSESHLLLGSGRFRVAGGYGSKTFLHADTPDEAEGLKKLYHAAWNELCRFRQHWSR